MRQTTVLIAARSKAIPRLLMCSGAAIALIFENVNLPVLDVKP